MFSTTPAARVRTRARPQRQLSFGHNSQAFLGSPGPTGLELKIVFRDPAELRELPGNPRRYPARQLTALTRFLKRFGFLRPVLINADDEVVVGAAEWKAACSCGMGSIPTIRVDQMSKADQRAYRLLEARLPELGEWDSDLLRIELEFLSDFDTELVDIGWTTPEYDVVMIDPDAPPEDPADALKEPEAGAIAVSRRGDLWLCDTHRVLCGDALVREDYARLLGGERAQYAFTDPSYNVPKAGHVTGGVGVREFATAHGEMNQPEFTGFLQSAFRCMAEFTAPGAILAVCQDWRHLREILDAGYAVFDRLVNLAVWAKSSPGMGSLYRSQHELVLIWHRDKAPAVNNVEVGKRGRSRSNLWSYPGAAGFGRDRDADLAPHSIPKPVAMVADAIKDCSDLNGIVLDPFGGSGTTMIAAAKTKRRGYLIEIDPLYVDTIVRRWEDFSGKKARHAETGLTFDETAISRAAEVAISGKAGSSVMEAGHVR
jgi:DNA modification methylase